MPSLYEGFLQSVGGDVESSLMKPGPQQVARLFSECGLAVSEEQLQEVYGDEEWNVERSFTWSEFHELAVKCGLEQDSEPCVASIAAAQVDVRDEGTDHPAACGDEGANQQEYIKACSYSDEWSQDEGFARQ